MRYAAKRDIAEPAIVEALEARGYYVKRINSPDAPDLLVCSPGGSWMPLGVKTSVIFSRLTKSEQLGVKWPLVQTAEDALRIVGALR